MFLVKSHGSELKMFATISEYNDTKNAIANNIVND